MTDAVTYAELRFSGIALRETQHGGSTPEDRTNHWDDMYENVTGPQPPRRERSPPTPAKGRGRRLMADAQVSGHLQQALIQHQTTFSSLTQSLRIEEELLESIKKKLVSTESELEDTHRELEKTQQNLEMVHLELKDMVENMLDLNSSHIQSVRRGEELLASMRSNLTATKTELEKAVQNEADLNGSLLQCLQGKETSSTERQKAEVTLNKVKSKMDQCLAEKRGLCPEGWDLFGNKCLWISKRRGVWERGRADCEGKGSKLITVQKDSMKLRYFPEENHREFWAGKELIWNSGTQEWKWPEPYQSLQRDDCLKISGGDLRGVSCTEDNWWICEKNLVLTSLGKDPYRPTQKRPEFTLGKTGFYCKKREN
ncbi:uncharacterized protein [Aquarana catesbeiana]|uniref:uncharacterized protein isoform X2 n=1 Tax=Aquarana catesbeiana TaxID=8400 RepID=UPI003CC9424D